MTCYAVALLRNLRPNDEIRAYVGAIDATLVPFGGRFVIHGGEKEALEGAFTDDLIVIAFPDRAAAGGWYASPAYQAILPKRRAGADGEVFLIEGAGTDHRATDVLKLLGGEPVE